MSEWISVNEKAPPKRDEEVSVECLVFCEQGLMINGLYSFFDDDWCDIDGNLLEGVTHWQDLPLPPQA